MNADFLVLKIHDDALSLDELRDGEARPLGLRAQVRKTLGQAFPSIEWRDEACGVWWSGDIFSVEVTLPRDEEPVLSLTLRVRLHAALGASGWLPEDEEELDSFLVGLCDPNGWTLFELPSGRRYQFRDEFEDDEPIEPAWREAGPVN